VPGKLPNDWFKRPGPHHAHEASADGIAAFREAIDVLRRYGVAEPMAALMKASPDDVLRPGGIEITCFGDGVDFGMAEYGPLLSIAGCDLEFGEPLVPYHDATVEPISMFWADHPPYIPHHVSKASAIIVELPKLRKLPARNWRRVLAEMTERTDDAPELAQIYAKRDAEAPGLLETWRVACAGELARFEHALRSVAERDGWVMTWFSEQGWL